MGLGPLWCVLLALRVDALALIEMMNQVNPTLGQRLIGDALKLARKALAIELKNEVGVCCMVYLCSVNDTACGVFRANQTWAWPLRRETSTRSSSSSQLSVDASCCICSRRHLARTHRSRNCSASVRYQRDFCRADVVPGRRTIVELPGGISPPGAPRTVHDPLESHGSRCSAVAMA